MSEIAPLDSTRLPLQGHCLIEASAGTGKTYTLAALYLRALLGAGDCAWQRPLSVEEILVVTFTEAATQELRDRIRRRIQQARQAFVQGDAQGDPLLADLLATLSDHPLQVQRLELASTQMDQAAIFTIHGFCQRTLSQHAFESGAAFNQTLLSDADPLVRQAVLDFWRARVYGAPAPIAQALLQHFSGPEVLLKALSPYLALGLSQEPDYSGWDLAECFQQFWQALAEFKDAWPDDCATLLDLISASDVDKRSYSRNYLPNWLAAVGSFARSASLQPPWDTLQRFSQHTLNDKTKPGGAPPQHPLFAQIDQLMALNPPVSAVLIAQGLVQVRQLLMQHKRQHQLLTFDDLLSQLAQALRGKEGTWLAHTLRQQYPLAMIDEFQDTDPLQYEIFQRIYQGTEVALLMIGDPKQSIYAFRGGDIFTYMAARRGVTSHHTLTTNWRSTQAMVSAVNRLFSTHSQPFIYTEAIGFQAVNASPKSATSAFCYQGLPHDAMTFWLAQEPLKDSAYQQLLAEQTAQQIVHLLSDNDYQIAGQPVQPADIAILVRTRKEASLMQQVLHNLGVASVFLSNRASVFSSGEARQLLYLLSAVADPADERALRAALATDLFQLSLPALYASFNDERQWEKVVEDFLGYRLLWQQLGVLAMLHRLLADRQLVAALLRSEQGERRLTNVLHLGELLQQASESCEGLHGLLRWLQEHIDRPNQQADEQQMRLESDRQRVSVITIHKSKGLEYPLVFLPFVSSYRPSQQPLYHDQSGRLVLDLSGQAAAYAQAEQERLAEDIRLLYVAVTRAVYACFIGVASLEQGSKKKPPPLGSALAYLLSEQPSLAVGLQQLASPGVIQVMAPSTRAIEPLSAPLPVPAGPDKGVRPLLVTINRNWRLTSYTALSRHTSATPLTEVRLELDESDVAEEDRPICLPASIFTFPKGAQAGTFLHSLLEQIDFTQASQQLPALLAEQLPASGFAPDWQPVLQAHLLEVLQVPLPGAGCSLSQVGPHQRVVEMEFLLSLDTLAAADLNHLLRQDPLSAVCRPLTFATVQGMLKGFIDLVFEYQGRFYIVDYKSNHLGYRVADYSEPALQQAMISHRYDLQYQLYTLALHRYLRQRVPDYDYQRHMGGVYYLFLRGMNRQQPEQGVFFTRPALALVAGLDRLFAAQEAEHA